MTLVIENPRHEGMFFVRVSAVAGVVWGFRSEAREYRPRTRLERKNIEITAAEIRGVVREVEA